MEFDKDNLVKIQSGQCPYCAKSGFIFTSSHIVQKHGIRISELRNELGVNLHTPLCAPEFSAICAKSVNLRADKNRILKELECGRRVSVERRPKHNRPEGRENQLKWLFSDRHLVIADKALHSPEAKLAQKETAKNRPPEIVKAQTERILTAARAWRDKVGSEVVREQCKYAASHVRDETQVKAARMRWEQRPRSSEEVQVDA